MSDCHSNLEKGVYLRIHDKGFNILIPFQPFLASGHFVYHNCRVIGGCNAQWHARLIEFIDDPFYCSAGPTGIVEYYVFDISLRRHNVYYVSCINGER